MQPASYQQTLRKAFTMGGLGLHTGAYGMHSLTACSPVQHCLCWLHVYCSILGYTAAYIQVRPAYANEGRYFVRVPEGILSAVPYLVPTVYTVAVLWLSNSCGDTCIDAYEAQALQC